MFMGHRNDETTKRESDSKNGILYGMVFMAGLPQKKKPSQYPLVISQLAIEAMAIFNG